MRFAAVAIIVLMSISLAGCALFQPQLPPANIVVPVSNCAGWTRPPLPLPPEVLAALPREFREWVVSTDELGRSRGCWE